MTKHGGMDTFKYEDRKPNNFWNIKPIMFNKKAQNENTKAVMQTGQNFWAGA